MDIKVALVMLLLTTDLCACSKMTMQQAIQLDLFSLTNSTLSPYLTKVSIGNPPKNFNVIIDTGSDVTWVDCSNTGPNFYDVFHSRTGSVVNCKGGIPCEFDISYKDGSHSFVFMASDEFHFRTLLPNMTQSQLSPRIMFGCSTMNTLDPEIDGILGLGRGNLSLVSQLFKQNIAPNIVSHCLSDKGGGVLLLHDVLQDGITYAPLIPSNLGSYQVSLESISVNNKQIRAELYGGRDGTIFDSGTTLMLLAGWVYDGVVDAVSFSVNKSVLPGYPGSCYDVPHMSSFPQIKLYFENGASMMLMPHEYLIYDNNMWCLGFQRDESMTILGDLVLRDKVVVYDQLHDRIGWVSHDCSQPINISWIYNSSLGGGGGGGSGSVTWRAANSWNVSFRNVLLLLFTCFIVF